MATENYAYTTLITRGSYLAGVLLLAYTLRKHGSKHPLVVLYTPSLPQPVISVLQREAPRTNLILQEVSALLPRSSQPINLIAERFADTWTKLRVFSLTAYTTVCYLDADMILCRNMDAIFSVCADLPGDCIAANHACVCNKDRDPWAPAEWVEENCAYTPMHHPETLNKPTPVTPEARPTYHLLNSGMFVFHPSQQLWDQMLDFFNTTPKLSEFKFPDQDFLAEFFRNRWQSVGWQYNALKTMRYWHPDMWRDEEVVCLHYIVDKPWAARIGEDGKAGYLGRDGVTHGWWWEVYREWFEEREGQGEGEMLETVRRYVARAEGEEGEEDQDMLAIGSKVQAFANNGKKDGKEGEVKKEEEPKNQETQQGEGQAEQRDEQQPPQPQVGGPVLRQRALGERGHGPVVRHPGGINPHGISRMDP